MQTHCRVQLKHFFEPHEANDEANEELLRMFDQNVQLGNCQALLIFCFETGCMK